MVFVKFKFAKGVIEKDSGLSMASLVVEFLFTNIPVEKTMNRFSFW